MKRALLFTMALLLAFSGMFDVMPAFAEYEEIEKTYTDTLLKNKNIGRSANNSVEREFYVSPDGKDSNNGTVNSPFKTIERARDEVRKYNRDMSGDIVVNIASGRYEISDSVEFEYDDSGCNGYSVIYRGYGDSKPQISGGKKISGFTEQKNGIWTASVDLDFVRELSVNGVMAQRAKSSNKIYGTGAYNPTYDSGAVTKTNPDGITGQDGFYVNKSDLGIYKNFEDVELKWDFAHQSTLMHVKEIVPDPQSDEQVIVKLKNPEWNSIFNTDFSNYNAPLLPGWNIAFSVENALELLDEPGEFYYDKSEKILYYLPRDGEDMNNAEVICPRIDKLIGVKGRGYLNKIKNIVFENIEFAHSTWGYLDEYSVYFRQAEQPSVNFAPMMMTPGAFEVDWADCLTIRSCDFYGISTVALKLNESVTNSVIEGNTFADIGCGAVNVGNLRHSQFNSSSTVPSGKAVVSHRKAWSSSSQPKFMPLLMQYIYTTDDYNSSHTWTNADELAENPNAKSWVRVDLGKPYDISSIKLSFKDAGNNEHTYTSEEMSNFEILVSNDRNFKDYEVVRSFGANTNRTVEVSESFDTKYRYVMFRKTASGEAFAITCYWVYSGDEDKIGGYESGLCVDNKIANNYITRVGKIHTGSPAITGYYTDGLMVSHNTIEDVPYSGISLGWGWATDNSTAKNNVIENNYIKDYMLQCNDGGGIYVLGSNYGTEIKGNYIKNGINGYGAIYFDTGSKGFTVSDNVADNTSAAIFQHDATSSADITITNTYTTFDDYDMYKDSSGLTEENHAVFTGRAIVCNGTANNCTAEAAVVMLPNNYTEKAAAIVELAGLESEWSGIVEEVPENSDGLYKGSYAKYGNAKKPVREYSEYTSENRRANYYLATFENIYENASFGTESWQYPVKYKYMIEEIEKRVAKTQNDKASPSVTSGSIWCRGVHIDEEYMMKRMIEDMTKEVSHKSYDEMVEICNKYLNDASEGKAFGMYQSGAINTLRAAMDEASAINRNTEAGEYTAVVRLENALNEFASKEYSDEVVYAYVKDGVTSIDRESKTVTVTLPFGAELSVPEFTAKGNTLISLTESLALDTHITLKAENSDVGGAKSEWSLVLTYGESDENVSVEPKALNWHNSNPNTYFSERGNSLRLVPWLYPYMYKLPSSRNIKVGIKADTSDTKDGISLIVASKSSSDLEYDATDGSKNTYYRFVLKGSGIQLYCVKNGTETLVAESNSSGFEYGVYNEVFISVVTENEEDKITLKIGKKTVFDNVTSPSLGADGYFGILTRNVAVDVVDMNDRSVNVKCSDDKKSFEVTGNNIAANSVVILALYDGDVLVDVQYKDYASKVSFTTKSDYTRAVVMVWKDLKSILPETTDVSDIQ